MAFTDDCDLYVAFHEEGVNLVIQHVMRQRPSWFNYASADLAGNRELWCEFFPFTSDVTKYGNPLFTILPPLPVIGADSPPVTLGFIVQITKVTLDFHPGNVVSVPAELNPPLAEQSFALQLVVCGAIACPDEEAILKIPVGGQDVPGLADFPDLPPVHLPGRPQCFCLELFVTGGFDREFSGGTERVVGRVDGVEIVDVKPEGLESNLECYIETAVVLGLRQKLAIPLETFFVDFPLFGLGTVSLSPTPNPPVPNNPAIEDDQVKAFITMTVTP